MAAFHLRILQLSRLFTPVLPCSHIASTAQKLGNTALRYTCHLLPTHAPVVPYDRLLHAVNYIQDAGPVLLHDSGDERKAHHPQRPLLLAREFCVMGDDTFNKLDNLVAGKGFKTEHEQIFVERARLRSALRQSRCFGFVLLLVPFLAVLVLVSQKRGLHL
ncbi:hypothetical protein RRF57_000065 [Xylaria bambusicola]|uniref:Uncharacterized protein n=1 Tax=Xylaria bambusicola TaxID=326684 RepID=A0AAN7UMX9_9PEZI